MSDHPPIVSILAPAYNAGAYLGELCDSIQAQDFTDFEVVILNDGSTDNTRERLEPYLKDRRFRVIHWDKNRGIGEGTRHVLAEARGEFWCYPGADDVLLPGFLSHRVEWLREDVDAALVHGPGIHIDENGRELTVEQPDLVLPRRMSGSDALAHLLQHNVINTPSIMARTSVTRRVMSSYSPDWRYAQDWFLWLLHAASGGAFLYDAAKRHKYRVHGASLTCAGRMNAVRQAEVRLVPLCALGKAAAFGGEAEEMWRRWKSDLYSLWLRRAWAIGRDAAGIDDWTRRAAAAYNEGESRTCSLIRETLRHAGSIVAASARERLARRRQIFPVSGLACLDQPAFRELRPGPEAQG